MPLPQDENAVSRLAGAPPDDLAAELRAVLQKAVRRVCPRWLADRSEDLVQASVIKVLETGRRGEGLSGVPASYLYKVAYTTLIDEIRRLRRRPEVPLPDGAEDDSPAAAAAQGDPEALAAAAEVGAAIEACLGRLAEPRRLAVTLHLQGHTVAQAAALLDWDGKRTENLVYRGLSDLRRCLESKGVKP
jgi:RNA polymerase sigma-70 factor (ECF subfamily)